jgi:hypothetical protein
MARSTYIWTVFKGSHLIGTFTVKHEMITWLGKRTDFYGVRVYRMPDGNPYNSKPVDKTAEILAQV